MERIYHIKETALPNQAEGESAPDRDRIHQANEYDPATETEPEQIKVREYLESYNEVALKEIFTEYYRKAGSVEGSINWIPFEKVRIVTSSDKEQEIKNDPSGSYSPNNGVVLYSHLLHADPELTLWTLIHEECHAISQDNLVQYPGTDENNVAISNNSQIRSGLSFSMLERKYADNEVTTHVFDEGINEGVTELLTERIFRKYKRRLGLEKYSQDPVRPDGKISDTEKIVSREKFKAYERNWQNAKLYIGIISAITDMPENVVEEAVIRTYIRNGQILPEGDSEVKEILDGVHPELGLSLYIILKSEKNKDLSLQAYVDEISRLDIPEELKQKINVVFQKIKEEWSEAYKLAPNQV
jgi:hypothetical protein